MPSSLSGGVCVVRLPAPGSLGRPERASATQRTWGAHMPLKLRPYGFLAPGLKAGAAGKRARVGSALAFLLIAAAGAVAGYSFGLGPRVANVGIQPPVALVASADAALVPLVSGAAGLSESDALRSELKALNAENARLVEERGAYQALLDPKTGIGREVSVSSLTVRPSTGGWKFFAMVSGGAVPSSAFKGNAVVELAGAVRGEEERVLADVPAHNFRLEYRNGQLISGEVAAAGAPASALRVLVVDEAGRTRATQRVTLP